MTGLAVFVPVVGRASETFVARHVRGLAPEGTVTVTRGVVDDPAWTAEPQVVLAGVRPSPQRRRLDRGFHRILGRPKPDHRWRPRREELDRVARALDDARVGIAMTEFLDVWVPVMPWLRSRVERLVAHAHGYDVSLRLRDPWWREQYARAYADVDAVVTVSEHSRRRLLDAGVSPSKVVVVPCGVDVPDRFVERVHRPVVHVVAVGRMVPKKDPLATVAAFRLASAQQPQLRLTMVGDGPLRAQVEDAVRAGGLSERVRLLGARPHREILELLADADLFAQHSVVSPVDHDEEGLPVAVLEAMAAGLPIVSTRHAGIPEAVEDGATGLLVAEGDVEGMAEALGHLAADPARRASFGAAAHARAADRFSWDRERRDLRALLGLSHQT